VVLIVQRPPVIGQFFHIVVDRIEQLTRRLAGLGVKDELAP
jgi:hypothetical protein